MNQALLIILQWDYNSRPPVQIFDHRHKDFLTPKDFSISLEIDESVVGCSSYVFNKSRVAGHINSETGFGGSSPLGRYSCFNNEAFSCSPNDFIQFRVDFKSINKLRLKFRICCKECDNLFAIFIGSQFLNSSKMELISSLIDKDLNVRGQFLASFLLIKSYEFTDEISKRFSRFDLSTVKPRPLLIGHRGSGSSYGDSYTDFMENTLNSFEAAWNSGADFVELDVQLTKDNSLVVYHDFDTSALIRNREKSKSTRAHVSSPSFHTFNDVDEDSVDSCSSIKVCINQLSLKELKDQSFFNSKSDNIVNCDFNGISKIGNLFPTLSEVLINLNHKLGVNIEIKSPQAIKSGKCESEFCRTSDLNILADKILDSILESNISDRKIFFSSFDPNICVLMKAKQDRYPVMFLIETESASFQGYKDMRTLSVESALIFAEAENLDGVVAFSNNIMEKIPFFIKHAHSKGLFFMSYGSDNNKLEHVVFQIKSRIDGIISDTLNTLIPLLRNGIDE